MFLGNENQPISYPLPAVSGDCDINQFACDNGHCIPIWSECNGFGECGDNSDEDHCGRDIM